MDIQSDLSADLAVCCAPAAENQHKYCGYRRRFICRQSRRVVARGFSLPSREGVGECGNPVLSMACRTSECSAEGKVENGHATDNQVRRALFYCLYPAVSR